ncbi:kelch repeat-containing protein [Paraflavisolibacter sp. H34]|uniref:kelch repeat-containing protein n=1 Tax=Huijunlia imazamoxiresistens TaxID=3127457 RepID=UPI003016CD8D
MRQTAGLWLYGGYGYGSRSIGYLNDLWNFNPATGRWTLQSGDGAVGVKAAYGTKGVEDAANTPGVRAQAAFWTDGSGNLWLFGGQGYDGRFGFLSDLWKLNPATHAWTFLGGGRSMNVAGKYGAKGVASATNMPGARVDAVSWRDGSGNLWLFGGGGYVAGAPNWGFLNDLWRFSPATGRWTWEGGDSTLNVPVAFGAKGEGSALHHPGGRAKGASWKDGSGNLWLFGGQPYIAGAGGERNDLWKFGTGNPAAGNTISLNPPGSGSICPGASINISFNATGSYG